MDPSDETAVNGEVSEEDKKQTTDETGADTESATRTAQSDAFRRQQRVVGVGGAVLAGGALATGLFQRFPDVPVFVPILAGLVGTALVLWLVRKSIFPGETAVAEESERASD